MNRNVLIALLFAFVLVVNGWTQSSSSTQRQLKRYTTYQTNLTKDDIMRSFVNEVRSYLQRYNNYGCYYWVGFEVYQEKDKQNWAWETSTWENQRDQWVTHTIMLYLSNAVIQIEFSKTSFSFRGQYAREIITTRPETVGGRMIRENIVNTAASMFNESEMVLKMYNYNYSDETKNMFISEILRILY